VHYCGEQLENAGSSGSSLLRTMKCVMTCKYSRELSIEVFARLYRLIELGFRQGGEPGYGAKARGDRKSLQTDRVVLVPVPERRDLFLLRNAVCWTISCLRKPPAMLHYALSPAGQSRRYLSPTSGSARRPNSQPHQSRRKPSSSRSLAGSAAASTAARRASRALAIRSNS
jgi:hypothetical protein